MKPAQILLVLLVAPATAWAQDEPMQRSGVAFDCYRDTNPDPRVRRPDRTYAKELLEFLAPNAQKTESFWLPTAQKIRDNFNRGRKQDRLHVVVFVGHGAFDWKNPQGVNYWAGSDHNKISEVQIAELAAATNPTLVVSSACGNALEAAARGGLIMALGSTRKGQGQLTYMDPRISFYQKLVNALSGEADRAPKDGAITMGEVHSFLTEFYDKPQYQHFYESQGDDGFVLRVLPGGPEPPLFGDGLAEGGCVTECEDPCAWDLEPPQWFTRGSDLGPPFSISGIVYDEGSGLTRVEVVLAENVRVAIAPFEPAALKTDVDVNQIDPNQPSHVVIEAEDNCERTVRLDPVYVRLEGSDPGGVNIVGYRFSLLETDRYLFFRNHHLTAVSLRLNGWQFVLLAHPTRRGWDGNVFYVPWSGDASMDISDLLEPGDNVLDVSVRGSSSTWGLLMIHDGLFAD
ncbi:MAG: hypothetical protein AB1486_07475 [Planctomycetota bacterium]